MPSEANSQGNGWVAETLEAPVGIDPLAVAGGLPGLSIYWEQPSEGLAVAGFGIAGVEEATDRQATFALLSRLGEAGFDWPAGAPRPPGPWFGGLAFDLSQTLTNGWTGFPLARWLLPELLVWTRGGQTYLTSFARQGAVGREQLRQRLTDVRGRLPAGRREPTQPRRTLAVRADPVGWGRLIEESLATIGAGVLSKVVAARAIDATSETDFDALEVLARLRAYAPSCTTFLFQGSEGALFVGSTPETLCRVADGVVETEALAGTAPPNDASGWLERDKERREHNNVTDAILEGLRPLSDSVEVGAPVVLSLRNVKHLRTPIRARLRPGVGAAEVVKALHPTPAVGGTPRELALSFLREHEGMERGWYAGAVGWIGAGGAEIKVGLRSALLHGRTARLFVGAGVVAGSTVKGEWKETEAKSALMLNALGGQRMSAVNVNQQWARALLEELVRGGVRHAVVCPGSRSTPLALACAERPEVKLWTVIDERGAAFFALGLGKETGQPVALVATSGTAGANFYPAVIEAALGCVPLVVLTADRPLELQGWGAPQTMPQQHLYGGFARWFADLGIPEATAPSLLHLRATAARAVATATRAPRGPVQLNAQFREPLAPVPDGSALDRLPALATQGRPGEPLTRILPPEREPSRSALSEVRARLESTEAGVIVCGPRDTRDGLPEAVLRLGRAYGYPVLAEATSQVRFGHPDAVALYDGILRNEAFARAHRPGVVLRFGGGLTPKGPQAWLDGSGAYTVQFSDDGALVDPQHSASLVIEGDPVRACEQLAEGRAPRATAWSAAFASAERRARAALEESFAQGGALTEPRIAREVVSALPAGARLFVSSSMPIRAVDGFAATGNPIRVLANRGVNGIDGITSSALGVAAGSGAPTVLLVGDLAFLHDLGGLLTAHRHRLPITVVVVQNDGGGIFSFLPIARQTEHFELLFGTPHGLKDLSHAAGLFGARYTAPRTVAELRESLRAGLEGGLHLVEAWVDCQANPEEHRSLLKRIADALGEGPWL